MRRRDALGAIGGAVATAALTTVARGGPMTAQRQPAIFLPHGGGPWPFVDLGPLFAPAEKADLARYLREMPRHLPARPKSLLVISAHWEEAVPTVSTAAYPPMLYDYYGFPPASYRIQWPAPGSPALAERVRGLLSTAGMTSATNDQRGFDHGTFIPLKVSFPDADIPTVQLSLVADLDPQRHLAIGRALAPLRAEGVLIVGSGMSYHNLRAFMRRAGRAVSERFDAWLKKAALAPPGDRVARLTAWADAPGARQAHPREEHLLPLMVVAGAAGADPGHIAWNGLFGDARISAVHYG